MDINDDDSYSNDEINYVTNDSNDSMTSDASLSTNVSDNSNDSNERISTDKKKHFPLMLFRYIRRANNIRDKKKRIHISHEIINDHMYMYLFQGPEDQNENMIERLYEWLMRHWQIDKNILPVKRRLRALSHILVCTDILNGINEKEFINKIILIYSDDPEMIKKLIHMFPEYNELIQRIIYDHKSLFEKIRDSWLIDHTLNSKYLDHFKNSKDSDKSKKDKCMFM